MTNEQKAKVYIKGLRKFLDKIPNLIEYKILDENQIYEAIVNNKDKWFWRVDIVIEYYIEMDNEEDSNWVGNLHKYVNLLSKSLEIENIILPDITFKAEVRT